MIGFPITFWIVLLMVTALISLIAKRQNFSKQKTVALITITATLLIVLPLTWFEIIEPEWRDSIRAEIDAANYCNMASDCVIEYFDGVTCGSYVNKNEVSQIYSDIRPYRIINPSGCMGRILSQPKCENNKCVGTIAD